MDNEILDFVPTQPPDFNLPYGWIEVHALMLGAPTYIRASEISSVNPYFYESEILGSRINIHYDLAHVCRETPEEVMGKITKSYPSISERFGGCV